MTTTALFYRKQGFEKTQNHVLRLLFEKLTKKENTLANSDIQINRYIFSLMLIFYKTILCAIILSITNFLF